MRVFILWCLLFPICAMAFQTIDNSLYFPAVAQGHHGDSNNTCADTTTASQLVMYQGHAAKIIGTQGRSLNFCVAYPYIQSDGCDTTVSGKFTQCQVTGKDLRGFSLLGENIFQSVSGQASSISYCNDGDKISLGEGTNYPGNKYSSLSFYNGCKVEFSSAYSSYYVTSLSIGKNAKIYLSPGDYWVENLQASDNAIVIPMGKVRIFIKNFSQVSKQVKVNPDSSGELTVLSYSSLQISDNVTVNGYIYANDTLYMYQSAQVMGRVTANKLYVTDTSKIIDKVYNESSALDHFEFSFSSNALTCNPQTITLKACANSDCSNLAPNNVTATLTGDGWSNGSNVTFTGATTLQLQKGTPGSVTLGVSQSVPGAVSSTLCRIDSKLPSSNCTLTFADSGFVFDVPDKIANQPATGVVIKAVKKDDSTKQCVPGFASVSRTLNFWSSYISPNTTANPAKPTVTVNGTAVGASAAAPVSIPLAFDSAGQVTLSSVNYVDAGQMQLNASYTGSTTNGDAGLVMTGSDQFISRPLGLCVQPETTCSAGNVSCPYFKRAGEPFTLTISGRAWEKATDTDLCSGNITTPNFALAAIPLGSTLVAPASGVTATVGTSSYNHQASSSGTQTVSQSVSEVGVFKFTATPPSYLGMTIPAASSLATGRFTPYNFAVSNGSVTAGCGNFSYMGQPMPTSFTVTARNSNGGATRNYRDEFARGGVSLASENGDNGVSLSSRLSGLSGLSWQAGLFTANQYPEIFARNTPPDGPFSQLAIGVRVDDPDDIPLLNRDMNVLTSGSCGSSCSAVRISTQDLRHGRLSVSSGRGAVDRALALPLTLESYIGSGWQRNADDGCTQLDLKASGGFVFDRSYDAAKAQLTLIDNSATSRLALATSRDTPTGQPTSATAQAGYIWLHFTAPGISDRVNYQLDLSKQPKQPTWLSFDWNGDGVTTVSDMGGWAFFNQWRSSDRVIYRREVLN